MPTESSPRENSTIKKKNLFDMIEQEQSIGNHGKSHDKKGEKKQTKNKNIHKDSQKLKTLIPSQKRNTENNTSFSNYPLSFKVNEALKMMGYTTPTKIQAQSLKHSLGNTDMLCLSQTGSGKTLSFVVPVMNYISSHFAQKDLKADQGLALILAPTRELCIQIKEYFDRFLECGLGCFRAMCIYGGVNPMEQVIELSKKPSVLVCTPGRLLDHLNNTKGFDLNNLKYLILDEADKLLNKDFELQFDEILKKIPSERVTFLYSATLTHKIEKLQRLSLKNPTKVEVSEKYQTVSNLKQYYIFIPSKHKDCYLLHLLHRNHGKKVIIFLQTKLGSERISLVLKELGFKVECLHGDMSQTQRIIGLQKFKKDQVNILVCTEVAARGLDINQVEMVMNYDLCDAKNYVHRVGRTARIGNSGISISFVTQYDVEAFQKIEERIGKKMELYPTDEKEAELFLEKLQICHHEVTKKMNLKHKMGKKGFKTPSD